MKNKVFFISISTLMLCFFLIIAFKSNHESNIFYTYYKTNNYEKINCTNFKMIIDNSENILKFSFTVRSKNYHYNEYFNISCFSNECINFFTTLSKKNQTFCYMYEDGKIIFNDKNKNFNKLIRVFIYFLYFCFMYMSLYLLQVLFKKLEIKNIFLFIIYIFLFLTTILITHHFSGMFIQIDFE